MIFIQEGKIECSSTSPSNNSGYKYSECLPRIALHILYTRVTLTHNYNRKKNPHSNLSKSYFFNVLQYLNYTELHDVRSDTRGGS